MRPSSLSLSAADASRGQSQPEAREPDRPIDDLELRTIGARPYLRQDAAAELRRYILAAKLQPGVKLPSERELSGRLGLSRNSVREAMRFLEHEGWVEV